MGSDGGAWAMDPRVNDQAGLRAAGHRRRPDRDASKASAATRSTPLRSNSHKQRAAARAEGHFDAP